MDFLRSILSTNDRGFIVIKRWRVAYARVPKAANTSIKMALAQSLELPKARAGQVSRDAYWRGQDRDEIEVVTPRQFASPKFNDYFCFSVVRHPFERIVSCYKNKILRNGSLRKGLARDGFRLKMSLDDFIEAVCRTSDKSCNVHVRSQATMLTHRGRLLPQQIVKFEQLEKGWPQIVSAIEKHSGAKLPALQTRNTTARVTESVELNARQKQLLRRRYADDFKLFYPS